MEYDQNRLVSDFAERTLANLELVRNSRRLHPDKSAYEVTQLINSMLGLLVFPKEEFMKEIPQIPLGELQSQGWPIPDVRPEIKQAVHLQQFLCFLRNGIAHFNVEFLSDKRKEISGIRIWNESRDGTKNWEADLTLEQLEGIAVRFIEMLKGINS